MIRFIFVAATVILFLILSIPLMLVEFLIGKKNRRLRDVQSLAVIQCVFRLILWMAGVKITVKGRENVPTGPGGTLRGEPPQLFRYPGGICDGSVSDRFCSQEGDGEDSASSSWMKLVNCLFLDRVNLKEGLKSHPCRNRTGETRRLRMDFPGGRRKSERRPAGYADIQRGKLKDCGKERLLCGASGSDRDRRSL